MDAPWLLDELAHAGPEHLDPAFVAVGVSLAMLSAAGFEIVQVDFRRGLYGTYTCVRR